MKPNPNEVLRRFEAATLEFDRAFATSKQAKPAPQDEDDKGFAAYKERERLRDLAGPGRVVAPAPQKSVTEQVENWGDLHAAEGIGRTKALADRRKRSPELVAKWVAEVNQAAGRTAVAK